MRPGGGEQRVRNGRLGKRADRPRDGDAGRGAARPDTLEDRPVRVGRPAAAHSSRRNDGQGREVHHGTRHSPGRSHRHAASARPAASRDSRGITASSTASARP
jgi:hypothetical protein